jgi:hypothetical protein
MKNPRNAELARLALVVIAREQFLGPRRYTKLLRQTNGSGELLMQGRPAEYSFSLKGLVS